MKKILITEGQYRLLLKEEDFSRQINDLIKNKEFELALILAEGQGMNLESILKSILFGEYNANDEGNSLYLFDYQINDVEFIDFDNKYLLINVKLLDGTYFHYDGEDEEYIQIQDHYDDGYEYDIVEYILDSIKVEFTFLEDWDIDITFF
jgi:hypothetical protein